MADKTFRAARAVTAADADIGEFDALFVGTGGTVILTDENAGVTTWTVPTGGYVYCRGKRVALASTATGIIALNY